MRILLLGEYSNVHATLAEGLRQLGHEVTVVSNGDFWKDYPRDIDVSRPKGRLGGVRLMMRILRLLPRLRGFDVVQLINPMFFELRAERLFPIYRYLRRHNGKMVLCAMGMDYYWVHESTYRRPMRYSDFNIGEQIRTDAPAVREQRDWMGTAKERLNRMIAEDCDAIVAGLYDDYVCYEPNFPQKTHYIPLPIVLLSDERSVLRDECLELRDVTDEPQRPTIVSQHSTLNSQHPTKVSQHSTLNSQQKTLNSQQKKAIRFFIGISKGRSAYKGTDIMLHALEDVKAKYPEEVEIVKAEGVPFEQYQHMMESCDAILDQLYSYTPAMNALLAMSKGIICIGGGEPEHYDLLGEHELQPIINVEPSYESVYAQLEQLVLHPERLPQLKQQSIEYVNRHHDHLKVSRQYERLYGGDTP